MKTFHQKSPRTLLVCQRSQSKTQDPNQFSPFDSSLCSILIEKCGKCIQELDKGNIKQAKESTVSIEKDFLLLSPSHKSYARLLSLVLNIKGWYYRKAQRNELALKCVDEAARVEKQGNVNQIDVARTSLNKGVIARQIAKERDNESAIKLVNEALEIINNKQIKNEPFHKEQPRLGQLILTNFYALAKELISLHNEKQVEGLYKKAYSLSVKALGKKNNLAIHLKNIINENSHEKASEKKNKKQSGPNIQGDIKMQMAHKLKEKRRLKKCYLDSTKMNKFMLVYNYDKRNKQRMQKQLQKNNSDKLKKSYHEYTNFDMSELNHRSSIKDILIYGGEVGSQRTWVSTEDKKRRLKSQQQLGQKRNYFSQMKMKTQIVKQHKQQQPLNEQGEHNCNSVQKSGDAVNTMEQQHAQQKEQCQLI